MNKYSTWVAYASGRTEILYHKNRPEMERQRGHLEEMPTVTDYRTPTKQDLMEKRL